MNYARVVWDPHTTANINKLEVVQRRSVRFSQKTTTNKCSVWLPLQQRRKNNKLLMFYKIIHGLVAVPIDCLIRTTSSVRGHNQCYIIPHTWIQLQTSFFPNKTRLWNDILLDIVNPVLFEAFESKINKLYKGFYLAPAPKRFAHQHKSNNTPWLCPWVNWKKKKKKNLASELNSAQCQTVFMRDTPLNLIGGFWNYLAGVTQSSSHAISH